MILLKWKVGCKTYLNGGQACKVCKQSKNPIGLAVWGVLQEKGWCLDFSVMPGFQFFQSFSGGVVENVVHGAG